MLRERAAAIGQAVVIALLLAVGGGLWRTHEAAARLPLLEAKVDELVRKLERAERRAARMETALGVLEERSRLEGREHGRRYARVED